MKNVVAVLAIAVTTVALLTVAGAPAVAPQATDGTSGVAAAPSRWEFRVVSTRVAPAIMTAARSGSKAQRNDSGAVRFADWPAEAEAEALRAVEEELNRLSGEGWEMCSASDGAMVFRRAN